jgi:hypothetical protein
MFEGSKGSQLVPSKSVVAAPLARSPQPAAGVDGLAWDDEGLDEEELWRAKLEASRRPPPPLPRAAAKADTVPASVLAQAVVEPKTVPAVPKAPEPAKPRSVVSLGAHAPSRPAVESLEDRQWQAMVDAAKARLAQEENEWKVLLERARNAAENEEREWERLRARAAVKSSGAFPAQPGSLAPSARSSSSRT